jgi:curli biogenesis system outer membrane secretion channel CsgG
VHGLFKSEVWVNEEGIMTMRFVPCSAIAAVFALAVFSGHATAQPAFGNPSPTAGTETSQKANAAADAAAYREVEYVNKATRGPALVVIPGEVKSNNATFIQRFLPNNIADFGELELAQANFAVLERANLGNLLREVSLAYNLGDANKARQTMQLGKLKSTQWIVKFDILKAEQIAENREGFDGRAVGGIVSLFGGLGAAVAGRATSSVQTADSTGVWLIGMRYKIMDANTTEQVAQGYKELKMEVGARGTSVLGVSQSAKGGVGLDTMVQRLVQTTVYEIDSKYK